MPRWASRLILEVTGVRVERLQDISEEDAHREGVDNKLCAEAIGKSPLDMGMATQCGFAYLGPDQRRWRLGRQPLGLGHRISSHRRRNLNMAADIDTFLSAQEVGEFSGIKRENCARPQGHARTIAGRMAATHGRSIHRERARAAYDRPRQSGGDGQRGRAHDAPPAWQPNALQSA